MRYTHGSRAICCLAALSLNHYLAAQEIYAKKDASPQEITAHQPKEKSHKKKSDKKEKNGLKKGFHTAIKNLSMQELEPAKKQYLQNNQKEYVCSCLERMITLENDIFKQKKLRLELAELRLELNKFAQAGKEFGEFVTLYPNSSDTEFAHHKAIDCFWQETLTHDRDQSKTHDCLSLAEKYLGNSRYKKHRIDVQKIVSQCYEKLVNHETYVCKFYLKKGRNAGARQRIEHIRKNNYLEQVPELEQDVLILECECAQKNNDTELFKKKTIELAQNHPEQTNKTSKKRSHAQRF